MKIAIFGSPDFPDLGLVRRLVIELPSGTVVVSGDAGRVASAAQEAARERGLEVVVCSPNWSEDGRRARLVMNEEIILGADEVLVFWDLKSNGTANNVRLARGANKAVRVIGPDGGDASEQVSGRWPLRPDHLERLALRRQRGRALTAAMAAGREREAQARAERLREGIDVALEREAAFLGALIVRPREIRAQSLTHEPWWFLDDRSVAIMDVLVDLAYEGRAVTVDSVVAELAREGKLDRVGGKAFIEGLVRPSAFLDDAFAEIRCEV